MDLDGALDGISVLDFSTLLPGPLATAVLAEAGAEVIKVERPGGGDEMRSYVPSLGPASGNFALLNRGKRSIQVDLKAADAWALLEPLLHRADVLVEQFRPGVMDRLGFGYEAVQAVNPEIVYCSISGYRPSGPDAGVAAHDLNYVAAAGLLDLVGDAAGEPVLPHVLIADIGGGAYPAAINVALALLRRQRGGGGAHLEIAMADNVRPFLYWAQANAESGSSPRRGSELLTGGSPRYALYRTADGRHLAAAPLEDRFWRRFCEAIELPEGLREDGADPIVVKNAVAELIASRTAAEWEERLDAVDACCNVVRTVDEALADAPSQPRVTSPDGAAGMSALALPVAAPLRRAAADRDLPYPRLGEDAQLLAENPT